MIHHITLEIERRLIAEEHLFWACLGFAPTTALPRGRRKVHWLVNVEEGFAIHLHPEVSSVPPRYQHIAFVGDFVRRVKQLEAFDFGVELASPHFGAARVYTVSPSGHHVELMTSSPSIKAGMPAEE